MKKLRNWFIGDLLDSTENVFDRAKIEFLFNYTFVFIVIGSIFMINLTVDHIYYHLFPTSFALLSLSSIPFILKYRRSLKTASNWYVAQQVIVSACSVLIQEGRPDIAGGWWVALFLLCSFFLYGVKWGFILTISMIVVTGIPRILLMHIDIPDHQQISTEAIHYSLYPLSMVFAVTSMFIRSRSSAEKFIDKQRSELELKNKEVSDSIAYAERIQKAILPSHRNVEYTLPGSFVVYLPKDIVSGDFYWVEKKEHISYFAVADCTGHGVPGAMMSVICNNALNRVINEFQLSQPAEILDKLNLLVEESFSKSGADIRDGMDIALCSVNFNTRIIEYAGANNSLYYFNDGQIHEIKGNRQPIGRFESKVPFKNHTVQLEEGDFVYLLSDGIADQFGGPQGKKFKYKRVKDILLANAMKPVNVQKNALLDGFRSWKGNLEQVDDVCLMGVRM